MSVFNIIPSIIIPCEFSTVPAIPITHCDPGTSVYCPGTEGNESYQISCGSISTAGIDRSDGVSLNYRTYVNYGQFRTICKCL